MASLNKIQLIGHLGADPEVIKTQSDIRIASISVATTESWKDKVTGEKKEHTEWHRVLFFQRLADVASTYLKKGSQIFVEGRLQTRKWTDKEGIERYTTEIVAQDLQMLGKKPSSGEAGFSNTSPMPSSLSQEPPSSEMPSPPMPEDDDPAPFWR